MTDISDRLLNELVDAVKDIVRKEQSDRLRDIYLIGDIEKDSARVGHRAAARAGQRQPQAHHASTSTAPAATSPTGSPSTTRSATSSRRASRSRSIVQGMAYSMGSVVLQAASPGRRLAFPHSWIMIHEPAKWAGWQSTTAAAQHLDRLKQMQSQIYRILAERSGKPLRQIIRDTKRTDFYLDAAKAKEYGLIDEVLGPAEAVPRADDRAALAEAAAAPESRAGHRGLADHHADRSSRPARHRQRRRPPRAERTRVRVARGLRVSPAKGPMARRWRRASEHARCEGAGLVTMSMPTADAYPFPALPAPLRFAVALAAVGAVFVIDYVFGIADRRRQPVPAARHRGDGQRLVRRHRAGARGHRARAPCSARGMAPARPTTRARPRRTSRSSSCRGCC